MVDNMVFLLKKPPQKTRAIKQCYINVLIPSYQIQENSVVMKEAYYLKPANALPKGRKNYYL